MGNGLIGEKKRASYNYWLIDDDEPMKKAHIYRYAVASRYVSGVVCDLACGWGMGTRMLHQKAKITLGVDADEEVIAYARTKKVEGLDFQCADLADFEIPECHWVVSLETIEHLQYPDNFIAKCKQSARKGVVISAPVGVKQKNQNPFHISDITEHDIRRWFKGWTGVYSEQLTSVVPETQKVKHLGYIYVFERK